MNKKALHTLEYDKIIERLAGYAQTDEGIRKCRGLRPLSNIDEIQGLQKQTRDGLERLIKCGDITLSGIKDLSDTFKRLEIGSVLNTYELLSIGAVLTCAKRAVSYDAQRSESKRDSLSGYFRDLNPLVSVASEISRCIISETEIADDASPALKAIRRRLSEFNSKIKAQVNSMLNSSGMKTYLQDSIVTMRDGHYCLPVKAEYQGNVSGVIYDRSSTGSTVFIEPSSVTKMNNEFLDLQIEEEKEIEKILARLSSLVSEERQAIVDDYNIIVALDFIYARSTLAEKMNATRPEFCGPGDEKLIRLKKARHPLLDPQKTVPINVSIGDGYSQLIITGPNTGGKTVTLKTVGLLSLMGQAGLHIPANEESRLCVFNEIYADIGDEQSIEQSLSTFSSHMKNIVYIMGHADRNSLVLFDELCSGTDPAEGAALAISILSSLLEKHIFAMSTTHYSELKVYALSTDGAENASCEFDVETLSPTYRLLIGIPGKSNAFAISKKLGLSDALITKAKEQLSTETIGFEDLISDLETRRIHIEEEEIRASQKRREADSLQEKLDSWAQKTDDLRNQILEDARQQASKILKEAKDKADESIRNINKYGSFIPSEKDAVRKLEKERASLRESISKVTQTPEKKTNKKVRTEPLTDPKLLKIGDTVKVLSMDMKGTVHTLPDPKGNLTVQMGILKYQANVSDVLLIKEESLKEKYSRKGKRGGDVRMSSISSSHASNVSTEINLIGKRAEEAIIALDKYLDDAALAHLCQVRIVHGKGSGILRQAVSEHLKTVPYVSDFHLGEFGEGDTGVTIATLDV